MDIHEDTNLVAKLGQGMLTIEVLITDSLVYDREAVLVISKAILAEAMPPGDAPGLYGFRKCRRRVRYSEIAHGRCGNTTLGQIFPQLNSLGINLPD
jgi:hypothetical protein